MSILRKDFRPLLYVAVKDSIFDFLVRHDVPRTDAGNIAGELAASAMDGIAFEAFEKYQSALQVRSTEKRESWPITK